MMKAPFKRGARLLYQHACGHTVQVTYVRWWGPMRSALIVVRLADKQERTVRVDEVKVVG